MQKDLKLKLVLLFIVIINFSLNVYGNNWGLPSRWHSDEKVANVLHMLNEKSLVDKRGYFLQPTGYNFFLAIWLIPYMIFLKLTGFSFEALKEAASVSWVFMAQKFPDFATYIYIFSRTLSAILGAVTVYLIFLLGKKIYDEKAGIFSSAFLAVCMGFAAVNHFAKYSATVNFLMVLTLLTCITTLEKRAISDAKKYFYISTFLAGIAVSVKFNSALLLVPVFLTFIFTFIFPNEGERVISDFKKSLLIILNSGVLFTLGFLILTPSFLIDFKNYFFMTKTLLPEPSLDSMSSKHLLGLMIGYVNYLIELVTIIGVPIFILISIGVFFRLLLPQKISKKEIIVLSFITIYWLIIIPVSRNSYPQLKYVIAIVPFLMLFAGKAMSDVFNLKKINYPLKWFIFLAIFLFSFVYAYYADLVFLRGDTRYASTNWIKENIPVGSKIEIFYQLHLVCADSILNDYEVIYLGASSKKQGGYKLPRWVDIENRVQYIEQLNKHDSSSDYIIININYMDRLYAGRDKYTGHLPGLTDYIIDLFEGKKNFVLVKTFAAENKKVVLKDFGNIVLPENIFWYPIPDYEAVSPTIYVFKKIEG